MPSRSNHARQRADVPGDSGAFDVAGGRAAMKRDGERHGERLGEREAALADEARLCASVLRLAAEVRQALVEDLAHFPMVEARRRFLADPDVAGALPDVAIARMKSELEAGAPVARDRVIEGLSDDALWLSGTACPPGEGRSFEEHPRLWGALQPVEALVGEVLRRHGLAIPQDDPVRYRMPMRFIGRRYLPGLAEKYWVLIEDLRQVRQRLAELDRARMRDMLGRRWDEA